MWLMYAKHKNLRRTSSVELTRLTMDMSCSTTRVPYWPTYCLHCQEEKKTKLNIQLFQNKKICTKNTNMSHHCRQAWSQQVTLILNVLNERINEWGVSFGFSLSVSQKLDAVLAHLITFLQGRYNSEPNEDNARHQNKNTVLCMLNRAPAWGPPAWDSEDRGARARSGGREPLAGKGQPVGFHWTWAAPWSQPEPGQTAEMYTDPWRHTQHWDPPKIPKTQDKVTPITSMFCLIVNCLVLNRSFILYVIPAHFTELKSCTSYLEKSCHVWYVKNCPLSSHSSCSRWELKQRNQHQMLSQSRGQYCTMTTLFPFRHRLTSSSMALI